MGLFTRLGRIFKAEANAAVDTIEDPTKISDQIIRELREHLQEALEAEASVKADALSARSDEMSSRTKAETMTKKAEELLDMIDQGKLDEAKGNELANTAAQEAAKHTKDADTSAALAAKEETALAVMDARIKDIRQQIVDSENTARMLKARAKSAEASEKINKTLSSIDTDGLANTLKRMDEKVTAQEFRSQAYSEINDSTLTKTQEIDKVLATNSSSSALDAIKAKRAAAKTQTV